MRRRISPGSLILGGVFAVVLAICLIAAVLALSASNSVKTNLGQTTFNLGSAKDRAKSADKFGPFGFRDPRGGTRDLWLIHLDGTRWAAVIAHLPNESSCRVSLDKPTKN